MGLITLLFPERAGDFKFGLELSFLFFCAGRWPGEEGDGGRLCLEALGLAFVLFPLVTGSGGLQWLALRGEVDIDCNSGLGWSLD